MPRLTSSVEHPQVISRQRLDENLIPRQLQRVYLNVAENG